MKKLIGLMILFFSLCIVVPSQAQSAAGDLLKNKSKEAREKIKEVTKTKTAEKKQAGKNATASRKWGATGKSTAGNKNDTRGQIVIPAQPVPVEGRRMMPPDVDTSQYNPW